MKNIHSTSYCEGAFIFSNKIACFRIDIKVLLRDKLALNLSDEIAGLKSQPENQTKLCETKLT